MGSICVLVGMKRLSTVVPHLELDDDCKLDNCGD